MKKTDVLFLLTTILIISAFTFLDFLQSAFTYGTVHFPYLMAFLKFACLATTGEMIALRLKTGKYNEMNYGLLPRSIVWGTLGILIAATMQIFSTGVPHLLENFGLKGAVQAMHGEYSGLKFITALAISIFMNCIFSPVFMTFHKITDTHIIENSGKLSALFSPIPIGRILSQLNWDVQWNFVFKLTVPLFWIPAHTLTFLLPPMFQVLFAASLSIVLGILLSMAAFLAREKKQS